MKPISIIVAIASNQAIGKDNQLLWHIPADLKRFKKITSGHSMIMGKNTFFSLPVRPLPNRRSIVLTDIADEKIDGCEMAYSIDDSITLCDSDKENFVIGGGSIYNQFLGIAQKMYITRVHKDFEADTFFPEINPNEWYRSEIEEVPFDESCGLGYTYETWERKSHS
jgi:dihydrofolate reductase